MYLLWEIRFIIIKNIDHNLNHIIIFKNTVIYKI